MADAEELTSGLGLVVSGLSLGLTIFFWPRPHSIWPRPHSSLASLTSLVQTLINNDVCSWAVQHADIPLPHSATHTHTHTQQQPTSSQIIHLYVSQSR